MNYVGIDHHRQYSHLTVMDQNGQVLRSGRVPNVRVEIEKFLEGMEAVEAVLGPFPLVSAQFDIRRRCDLSFPNDGMGQNCCVNDHSTSAAYKEFLISKIAGRVRVK